MWKIDDRVTPARHFDRALGIAAGRARFGTVATEPVSAGGRGGHALHLRHARQSFRHARCRREIEGKRRPLVGVILELGHRRIAGACLDRQQTDRRRQSRVVQQFGWAHRRAPGGRRQEPLSEVGEENRVDQLRLAARKLGDERDDELVLMESILQLLDLEVDLRVGEILLPQPLMQIGNRGR